MPTSISMTVTVTRHASGFPTPCIGARSQQERTMRILVSAQARSVAIRRPAVPGGPGRHFLVHPRRAELARSGPSIRSPERQYRSAGANNPGQRPAKTVRSDSAKLKAYDLADAMDRSPPPWGLIPPSCPCSTACGISANYQNASVPARTGGLCVISATLDRRGAFYISPIRTVCPSANATGRGANASRR